MGHSGTIKTHVIAGIFLIICTCLCSTLAYATYHLGEEGCVASDAPCAVGKVYKESCPYPDEKWYCSDSYDYYTADEAWIGNLSTVKASPTTFTKQGGVTFDMNADGGGMWYGYRLLVQNLDDGSAETEIFYASSYYDQMSMTWSPPKAGYYSARLVAYADSTYDPGVSSVVYYFFVQPSEPLSITTTSLPAGTVGLHYLQSLEAAGGEQPYTWHWCGTGPGFPPCGSTFDDTFDIVGLRFSRNGYIYGTAKQPVNERIWFYVNDSIGDQTEKLFDVHFNYPVQISGSVPTKVTAGKAISATLSGSGGYGYYYWSMEPVSGLSLSCNSYCSSTLLSGTLATPGTVTFSVNLSDSLSVNARQQYSIQVYSVPTISSGSLPAARPGQPYSSKVTATGGLTPYTWSYTGTLPAGLDFSSGTDGYLLSGTPQSQGSYRLTINLVDALGATASRTFTLNAYNTLALTTTSLKNAIVGDSYSQTLSASGGDGHNTWSISGSLPPGLTLNQTSGAITGTASGTGVYSFTVQVKDGEVTDGVATPQTASASFSIGVYDPLGISSGPFAAATAGAYYMHQMTATGGGKPYSWSITSGDLPAGLYLESDSGLVRGATSDVGTFGFTITCTDQATGATASRSYTMTAGNGVMQNAGEMASVEGCATSNMCSTASTTNIMSGAVYHDQELFSTAGTKISLFYNSFPAYSGPLGPGWSHTYDIFLTNQSDGSVVLHDGIRSRKLFTKSGSGFVSPPGDFSSLVMNSDNTFTIYYRDGGQKQFNGNGRLSSIVDRHQNRISFSYTGDDLTGIVDRTGASTTISYDQTFTPHRIASIRDPNGSVFDFSYEGDNCYNSLCRVTNPVADAAVSTTRGYWSFEYYPDGYLRYKTDPNGNAAQPKQSTQYTYYPDHRMHEAIDPNGQKRSVTYPTFTGSNWTSTLMEKDDGIWQFTLNADGVITDRTDPNQKTTHYTYYPNGYLKSSTSPKDGAVRLTTFYTYDTYGNLLTQTAPVDLASYTPAINPDNVADPATLSPGITPAFRYTYDNSNYDRLTSISEQRTTPPRVTTFAYTTEDGGDVVTATTAPGNYVTVTKYFPDGSIKEVTDANQKTASFTYYPSGDLNKASAVVGLLKTATDPAGVTTSFPSYDHAGNPLSLTVKGTPTTGTEALKLTISQQFDALNRLKSLTKSPATTTLPVLTTTYGYDNTVNVTSVADPENPAKPTTFEYDYRGVVKKITDAKKNDTVFKYSGGEKNGVDKLIGVFDAKVTKNSPLVSQPHTSLYYDKVGHLQSQTDPKGKKLYYTYYDNGLIKEMYDATSGEPGNLLASFVYNNLGLITDKNFPGAPGNTGEHYTYYPDGKLETARNQNISYTFYYYDDGRLQTVVDNTNSRTISYDAYDKIGQRKQVTFLKDAGLDERVVKYDYDNANRPWHVTSSAGTFTYSYDTFGRRDTLSYPNGMYVDWDFNDLDRLTAVTNRVVGGATLSSFSYDTYDRVGNRKSVSGTKNESYAYDELYRLLTVTSSNSESFDFDGAGNRQFGPGPNDKGALATDTSFVYNDANQLMRGRKLAYDYDNLGNQNIRTVPGATDKTWKQTWDLQNRLVQVEKIKGTEHRTVAFSYDPLGRRIGKVLTAVIDGASKSQSWSYVYDGDSIAVEIYTDENGSTTKTYYTQGAGVDEHLALERNGQFYYYYSDGLGSIATIADAGHNVVQTYGYDSSGMLSPTTSFRNSYAFTGREWDKETGLYYYRARYYDPMEGRFISKDPIGFSGGINLYNYVGGNPINAIDPSGNDFIYMVDANAVGGQGHAAAIVGPVGGTWTYNSYGPVAGSRAGQVTFTSEDAAMAFAKNHGYTDYAKWITGESSSAAAQNVANDWVSGFYKSYEPLKSYSISNNNCQSMVNSMANAAELSGYVGYNAPNLTFMRSRSGADYVGKFK